MIGWRAKLGVLLPSCNYVIEPEMCKMVPVSSGISLHFSRMFLTEDSEEEIAALPEHAKEASKLLMHAGVDIIGFGCTAGSFVGGLNYDKKIIQEIERITNIPVTTTSTALLEAMRVTGVKKISMVTPYQDWINQKEKAFFAENGVKVLKMVGMNLGRKGQVPEIGDIFPETTYELCIKTFEPGSDALFISCTGFRTIEIIKDLEEDLNTLVITSNQATLWHMFKKLNISTRVLEPWGQLMRR